MPRFRFANAARLCGALVVSGVLACAQAAELGEPVVRSHVGQSLIADIELTGLADPGTAVQVRLANADVYKGANIAMHPVLGSLNMSVMRRDGRQFLHITSVKPVDSENVHLFLDLTEGARRNVRAVTLWLTPDPTPAPRPPVALPVPLPGPTPQPVAPLVVSKAPVAVSEPAARIARPRPVRVISVAAPAAACAQPQLDEQQLKTCAALDDRNHVLNAQIVELEGKVKQLQVAMEGKLPPPPAMASKTAPAPAKTLPKPVAGFPWLLVIGIVLGLLVIGGAVWFVLRRRKGKTVEAASADSVAWYVRLAGPFRRKGRPAEAVVDASKDA